MSRLIAAKLPEDLHLSFQSYVSNHGLTISEALRKFISDGIDEKWERAPEIIPTYESGGAVEKRSRVVSTSTLTGEKAHWFYRDHFYELKLIAKRFFPDGSIDDFDSLPPSLNSIDGKIVLRKCGNGVIVKIK